jgi:LPXTG-site transpeptidase (sortase) family protein
MPRRRSRNIGLLLLPAILLGALLSVFPVKATGVTGAATLEIPALNISAAIVESHLIETSPGYYTWDVSTLGNNVGHLEGTAWMSDGQDKNIVLAGHKTLPNGRPAIFYKLNRIHIGDKIILSQGDITSVYVVTDQQLVDPSNSSVTFPTGKDQLTLVTCAGAYDAKAGSYLKRLVVTAVRAS